MKQTIILLTLVLIPSAGAIPPEYTYNNLSIKLYHPSMEIKDAVLLLDKFHIQYYRSITAIRFFNCKDHGYYHLSGVIDVCGYDCEILAHELAHNLQNNLGERIDHSAWFWQYNQVLKHFCGEK